MGDLERIIEQRREHPAQRRLWETLEGAFRITQIVTKHEMKWIPKTAKERIISAVRAMF